MTVALVTAAVIAYLAVYRHALRADLAEFSPSLGEQMLPTTTAVELVEQAVPGVASSVPGVASPDRLTAPSNNAQRSPA